ncbi:hypothetical protein [Alienimonas sp. DA493]|uniref:hypothetical protein n=1 Tax=Alienimonas sp. DA493 TaxID=3373605 RepID=UPI0037554164
MPELTRRHAAAALAGAAASVAVPAARAQDGTNPLEAAKGLLKDAPALDPSGLSELLKLLTSGDVTLRDLRRFGRPKVGGVVATVEGEPDAVGTFVGKLYGLPKVRPMVELRPLGFPKLNAVLATVSVGDVPGD